MVRNLFGALLALVGAAAAVFGPFRSWYGGRLGRHFRVEDLFTSSGVTGTQAGLFAGLFLPMLVAAGITLIGVLLRSRLVVALAGLVVLGFTALWMVRQGQDAGSLTAGGDGLGVGVAWSACGGLLLLIAAMVMRGRRTGARRRGAHARVDDVDGYGRGDRGYDYDYNHDDYNNYNDYNDYAAEPSEQPQPYGPFGTTPSPHGAYQAGGDAAGQPPPGRHRDDPPHGSRSSPTADDDEWDPWGTGPPPRAEAEPGRDGDPGRPPQGPQRQPPGPAPGPSHTQRLPRRPDHHRDGE